MEKIKVKVNYNGESLILPAVKGKRLKDLLSEAGMFLSLPCGGAGRCGRCTVLFTKGAPGVSDADRAFLSEKEIEAGKRLLCRCIVDRDCEIETRPDMNQEQIVSATSEISERPDPGDVGVFYGIAVDIGTTTIAAALISSVQGNTTVFDTCGKINHQRKFGADVISRISAAGDSAAKAEMENSVKADIADILRELLLGNEGIRISALCITGNTTMLHFLRDYDTLGLGKYPYEPVSTGMEKLSLREILSDHIQDSLLNGDEETIIMPGISAYVGADIVSGIFATDLCSHEGRKKLLVDLGTNGEMAFFDGKELYCTSTAAGPCFEGGGISCGAPSVPGAVSGVEIQGIDPIDFRLSTIGGEKPIGLCGTGIIELVSELVRWGIVDSTGLLADKYFDEGVKVFSDDIILTQKDIRNIQLAKAAIYAGADRLTKGEVPEEIFISGGFGSSTRPERIKNLKLFPSEWNSHMIPAGNTALDGAVKFLGAILSGSEDRALAENAIVNISKGARELILNSQDGFDETFVDAMNF